MVLLQIVELDADLRFLRIRTMVIVVDIENQHACGVLQHVNWDIHWGAETYPRVSLENNSIQFRVALHRKAGSNFSRCSIKRKAVFWSIYENQLAIAPPCWICQMDQPVSVDAYLPKWKLKDLLEVDLVYFVKRFWAFDNKWNIERYSLLADARMFLLEKPEQRTVTSAMRSLALIRRKQVLLMIWLSYSRR